MQCNYFGNISLSARVALAVIGRARRTRASRVISVLWSEWTVRAQTDLHYFTSERFH